MGSRANIFWTISRRHILDHLGESVDGPVVVDVVRAGRLLQPKTVVLRAWTCTIVESASAPGDHKCPLVTVFAGRHVTHSDSTARVKDCRSEYSVAPPVGVARQDPHRNA
jgi:hypothetical protein